MNTLIDRPRIAAGYPAVTIDPIRLKGYLYFLQQQGVGYGLGCKAETITAFPPRFVDPEGSRCERVDCSGFMRCLLYYATMQEIILPDGSWNQNDWCAARKFRRSSYAMCGLEDGHYRLCFHRPEVDDQLGHVWLVHAGVTMESWAGHGPGQRSWDSPFLRALVTDVYVLC